MAYFPQFLTQFHIIGDTRLREANYKTKKSVKKSFTCRKLLILNSLKLEME